MPVTTAVHHNDTIAKYRFTTTRRAELIARARFGHAILGLLDPAGYVERTLRHPAEVHDEAYLEVIEVALDHTSGIPGIDLVIYNSGMDPAHAAVRAEDLAVCEQKVFEELSAPGPPVSYLLVGCHLGGGLD